MKKNVITFIVMVAMLTATFLTGCDTKGTNTDTATIDQVVATADEASPTEDATATETEAKTEAPTEKSTEADKKKSDKDAEDNEEENENENNGTGSASNTSSNNSSSGGGSSTTNKKPSSSTNKKPSSSNNSSSSSSSSSSNNKPNNNSSSNNNSNSNNNNNSGNTNTKPAPTPVITDDTNIPHSQLCTDANMQKVTSAVNNYFSNIGMNLDYSLNSYNSGWFLVQTSLTSSYECSVNYFKNNTIHAFNSEVYGILLSEQYYSDGETSYYYTPNPSDYRFYCYAERQGNEYNIYFCYG